MNTLPLGGVIQVILMDKYPAIDWSAYPVDSCPQLYSMGEIPTTSHVRPPAEQPPLPRVGSLRETSWDIYNNGGGTWARDQADDKGIEMHEEDDQEDHEQVQHFTHFF
ncbi:hypothetical protein KSP39_PZI007291 [Platanthera zijinensis]|uniref:Uncharacterized protein n=1 Tax=Platanthera zijinensis TaxID=2320716 RepID=A0AAP0GAE0_9ASPA